MAYCMSQHFIFFHKSPMQYDAVVTFVCYLLPSWRQLFIHLKFRTEVNFDENVAYKSSTEVKAEPNVCFSQENL
jgi:hypothetical protein